MRIRPITGDTGFSYARLTRRSMIATSAIALGNLAFARAISPSSPQPIGETSFMTLSRLLIAHRLNPEVGRRLAAGMRADAAPVSTDIDALLALARSRNAAVVEDFFALAPAGLQQTALKIISAWYLGVVDDRPGGQVLSYEFALMFRTVGDVMTIPTYAISRPNGWGPTAPPLAAMPDF